MITLIGIFEFPFYFLSILLIVVKPVVFYLLICYLLIEYVHWLFLSLQNPLVAQVRGTTVLVLVLMTTSI
jgi:hypothetical protein